MAELNAFSFRPGTSLLHRTDVRFKMAFLVLISISNLKATLFALLILTVFLGVGITGTRLPLRTMVAELRYFLILLVFVFIARALTTGGPPLVQYKVLSVSLEGLKDGILVCWRFVIIVLAGLLFVTTTRPSEIKAAVAWFTRPFPGLRGKRVATMMSLITRFMPLILDQAKATADAGRARGVEQRKNPLYRLKTFAIPLVRRTFETADALAVAMESRCYSEKRTDPGLFAARRDWITLIVVICLCAVVAVI
ncbi:MAG: energy-coupling factor transporter transmembrane protein EcfT [Deltaproteobacteria bacterium]|nr:energy-coupling factor transporter transmembrane protein EcfT [Deltaproteobacteria bacterium]